MHLPTSPNLPINKLASVFRNTSATYKFYWFIALIELVEEGNATVSKKKMFARMISNSWYTINYFHLSFGKQDLLQSAVEQILKIEGFHIDEKKSKLDLYLENSVSQATADQLFHFDKNVPHRFLSPWFPPLSGETDKQQKARIYCDSPSFYNDCLYALGYDSITINPLWLSYLKLNAKILKDFCYWNLALFLQTRNPNVPDIPNKLIRPIVRNGLQRQNNEYWKVVFEELGSINCIFTETPLYFEEKNYALDHFIPHAFVSHDLIWNLLPVEKRFNFYKSDQLPLFEKHFDQFFNLQKLAFEINKHHNSKSKYMDEFLTIFPSIENFEKIMFANTIQPLITIASNNGFSFMTK